MCTKMKILQCTRMKILQCTWMKMEPFLLLAIISTTTAFSLFHSTSTALENCDSSHSVTLNCSGAKLNTFPSPGMITASYTKLDFSRNNITSISRLNFLSANHVEHLNLAHNKISEIESSAFERMTNLTTLDLSGNKLDGHKIMEEQFNIPQLSSLILQGNPLRLIGKDTFSFSVLGSLKFLDLSHCEISHIEEEGIMLPTLEYLDLSWNNLKTFSKASFNMLYQIALLDLKHNRIQVLDELPRLPKVKVLNFDYNQIRDVTLADEVWSEADALEELYIRGNDIIRFAEDSFPWDLDTLKGIYLEDNPIQCDCHMQWVPQNDDLLKTNFTIPCEYPVQLKGKNLLKIPIDDLRCSSSVVKVLVISGLSLVVTLCFFLIVYLLVRRKKYKKNRKPKTKNVKGTNYTAIYTKDEDDIRVQISDEKNLLSQSGTEFDV